MIRFGLGLGGWGQGLTIIHPYVSKSRDFIIFLFKYSQKEEDIAIAWRSTRNQNHNNWQMFLLSCNKILHNKILSHPPKFVSTLVLVTAVLFFFLLFSRSKYTGCFKAFGRRNEAVNRGVLGLNNNNNNSVCIFKKEKKSMKFFILGSDPPPLLWKIFRCIFFLKLDH